MKFKMKFKLFNTSIKMAYTATKVFLSQVYFLPNKRNKIEMYFHFVLQLKNKSLKIILNIWNTTCNVTDFFIKNLLFSFLKLRICCVKEEDVNKKLRKLNLNVGRYQKIPKLSAETDKFFSLIGRGKSYGSNNVRTKITCFLKQKKTFMKG